MWKNTLRKDYKLLFQTAYYVFVCVCVCVCVYVCVCCEYKTIFRKYYNHAVLI